MAAARLSLLALPAQRATRRARLPAGRATRRSLRCRTPCRSPCPVGLTPSTVLLACAQKKRKKSDKENEAYPLAPIEIQRAKTMRANKAHLASLGLESLEDKAEASKRKAEETKAKAAARKQARTEQNWTALCRVGTRVKVPGQIFESAVPPVVPPEVRTTPPPARL